MRLGWRDFLNAFILCSVATSPFWFLGVSEGVVAFAASVSTLFAHLVFTNYYIHRLGRERCIETINSVLRNNVPDDKSDGDRG